MNLSTTSQEPKEIFKAYEIELRDLNWVAARYMLYVAIIIIPVSLFWDWLILREYFNLFLIGRCIITFCMIVLVFALSKIQNKEYGKIISTIAFLIIGFGLAILLHLVGTIHPYYAMLNLLYLSTLIMPWSLRRSLVICITVFLTYLIPPFVFNQNISFSVDFLANNIGFQLETIGLVAITAYLQSGRRKKEILARLTIEHQKRTIETREREKNQFIANVSHELKTPLSVVIGYADILLDQLKPGDAQSAKLARLIQQGAFQLANHVDRFVNISHADNPDAHLVIDKYNYTGMVRGVFALYETRARDENKAYSFEAPDERLVVSMDAAKVEEALTNLIQNAFKFTKAGDSIAIRITADTENVHTEVIDSGVGIAQEKQGRLFERLFQADDVLSKNHAGMGIGLYLVKRNITAHMGDVTVESKPGAGSKFRFYLPLHVDQSADVKNAPFDGSERRETPRRSGSDRRAEVRRKRFEYQQNMGMESLAQMADIENIGDYENRSPGSPGVLVVEDNPAMMKVVVEALSSEYNLFLARNAKTALEKLAQHERVISLILTDVMMPEMNGFDFCERVMSNGEWKHIPLIFVSALMTQRDQLRGFSLGATDYIVKPYNMKILREKVTHWISRRHYEQLILKMSQALELRAGELAKLKDVMVHEIRNPLQVVEGTGFFLRELRNTYYDGASTDLKRCWDSIQSLQKAAASIKSVLELTRDLEQTGLPDRQNVPVTALFDDMLSLVAHLLGTVKLEIHTGEASALSIVCDKKMLTQVFVNIIRNAVEAINERKGGDAGRIVVTARPWRSDQVVIELCDNGIGIAEEVQSNLFRFKFTTKKDGTGIGLHFSRMICKLHNGDITVESKMGEGSKFSIYLPVVGGGGGLG